jgi:hypothetical protein
MMHKLVWLPKVACDPAMRGLPLAIAVLFATRYFHPKTGKAWPSHATLAAELGATRRNVQLALDRLIAAGWIECETGGGGRGQRNRYRMGVASDAERRKGVASDRKGRRSEPKKGVASDAREKGDGKKGGERRESARVAPSSFSSSSKRSERMERAFQNAAAKRTEGETFPAGVLVPSSLDEAERIAGWDRERAQAEFLKFSNYCREEGRQPTPSAWRNWCRRGLEFDTRDAKSNRPTREVGLPSALRGLKTWLDVTEEVEREGRDETE